MKNLLIHQTIFISKKNIFVEPVIESQRISSFQSPSASGVAIRRVLPLGIFFIKTPH